MFSDVLQRLRPFADEFSRSGKKIYLVGGAVRNILLGKVVQDFDFTTDALPSEVMGLFRKVLPTGLQHGTVTVLFRGEAYEVTTFRVDGDYSDGRRPDQVTFTPSLAEDLKRRDFTINAMALDLVDGTLHDPHDGQGDLERRILRAIGEPGKRFDEDALRLLRLFRFAAQLGFSIDGRTLDAVAPRRASLSNVSRERIREELLKAMAGDFPGLAWKPLYRLGFIGDIFPLLNLKDLSESAWTRLGGLPKELRWAFWLALSSIYQPAVWERVLKELTVSNQETAAILGPAKALGFVQSEFPVMETAKAIIEVWGTRERVDLGVKFLETVENEGLWCDSHGLKSEILRASSTGEPIFLGELAVGGRELLGWGVSPGPQVGKVLKELQREVWKDPSINSSENLLQKYHERLQ